MGVTSIGGHTRPGCNARYDVRIKLVETWLFVCLTWRGNVGRLFVMALHVVLTPMKSWTLIGREWINSVTCLNTRFWLVVPPSSDYYYCLWLYNKNWVFVIVEESHSSKRDVFIFQYADCVRSHLRVITWGRFNRGLKTIIKNDNMSACRVKCGLRLSQNRHVSLRLLCSRHLCSSAKVR